MKTIGSVVEGRDVYVLQTSQTVREAARYMSERRVGAAVVLDGDRLAGLLSERDIMGRVVAAGKDPDATRVAEVMTSEVVVAAPGDSYEEGVRKMRQAGCRHLPVVDGERFTGMVSMRDLMQIDLSEKADEIRLLNEYIHYVPPEA